MDGKFKVPALRNVAVTAPSTHDGYFTDLRGLARSGSPMPRSTPSWAFLNTPADRQ